MHSHKPNNPALSLALPLFERVLREQTHIHTHRLACTTHTQHYNRPQRWALHYELQLFERVLRHAQTAAAPGGGGGAGGGGGQHPFAPHLEWSLGAISSIIRCLHGLQVIGHVVACTSLLCWL